MSPPWGVPVLGESLGRQITVRGNSLLSHRREVMDMGARTLAGGSESVPTWQLWEVAFLKTAFSLQ